MGIAEDGVISVHPGSHPDAPNGCGAFASCGAIVSGGVGARFGADGLTNHSTGNGTPCSSIETVTPRAAAIPSGSPAWIACAVETVGRNPCSITVSPFPRSSVTPVRVTDVTVPA